MANFKDKILNSLKSSKKIENELKVLTKYQKNLINNHSNPVIKDEDKNRLLQKYSDLQNIGEALYRYNSLIDNECFDEAETEKENIENIVLKGSVSNTKYIWRSELGEHTCDACANLDGQEFNFYDEIPERPHPNCKCYVDIVEYENNGADDGDGNNGQSHGHGKGNGNPKPNKPKEEPCDCWDKIDEICKQADDLKNDLESQLSDIESLIEEDENSLNEFKTLKLEAEKLQIEIENIEPCSDDCIAYVTGMAVNIPNDDKAEKIMYEIMKHTESSRQVYQIFLEHKHEMEEAQNGMDKYYHAKANCTSAELGFMQSAWALLSSVGKEVYDIAKKTIVLHMDFSSVIKDSMQDLRADYYGLKKAKEHGSCSDKVRDVNDYVFKKK